MADNDLNLIVDDMVDGSDLADAELADELATALFEELNWLEDNVMDDDQREALDELRALLESAS